MTKTRDGKEEKQEQAVDVQPKVISTYPFKNPIYKKIMKGEYLSYEERQLLLENILEYFKSQITANAHAEFKKTSDFSTLISGAPTSLSIAELQKLSNYLKVISNHLIEDKMLIEMLLFMTEYLRRQQDTLNAKNIILLMFSCARYVCQYCLDLEVPEDPEGIKSFYRSQKNKLRELDDILRAIGVEDSFREFLDNQLKAVLKPSVDKEYIITWKNINDSMIQLDNLQIRNALLAANKKIFKHDFTVLLQPSDGSNPSKSKLFTSKDWDDFYNAAGSVIHKTMQETNFIRSASKDRCIAFYSDTRYHSKISADGVLRRFDGIVIPEDVVTMLILLDRFFEVLPADSLNDRNVFLLITVMLCFLVKSRDHATEGYIEFFAQKYISFIVDSKDKEVDVTPQQIHDIKNLIIKLVKTFTRDVLQYKISVLNPDEYSAMLYVIDNGDALPKYSQSKDARLVALKQAQEAEVAAAKAKEVKVEDGSGSMASAHETMSLSLPSDKASVPDAAAPAIGVEMKAVPPASTAIASEQTPQQIAKLATHTSMFKSSPQPVPGSSSETSVNRKRPRAEQPDAEVHPEKMLKTASGSRSFADTQKPAASSQRTVNVSSKLS